MLQRLYILDGVVFDNVFHFDASIPYLLRIFLMISSVMNYIFNLYKLFYFFIFISLCSTCTGFGATFVIKQGTENPLQKHSQIKNQDFGDFSLSVIIMA